MAETSDTPPHGSRPRSGTPDSLERVTKAQKNSDAENMEGARAESQPVLDPFKHLEQLLDGVKAQVTEMQEGQRTIIDNHKSLYADLKNVMHDVASLKKKVHAHDQDIERSSIEVTRLNAELARLNTKVQEDRVSITMMETDNTELKKQLSKMQKQSTGKTAALEQRMSQLETKSFSMLILNTI